MNKQKKGFQSPEFKLVRSELSDLDKRRELLLKSIDLSSSYSLSHTDKQSVIAICNHDYQVGVDIEEKRYLSKKARRYFLTKNEINNFLHQDIISLWTIKESIFKSYEKNTNLGLLDFEIVYIKENQGIAIQKQTLEEIYFLFNEDNEYYLSIAFYEPITHKQRKIYA